MIGAQFQHLGVGLGGGLEAGLLDQGVAKVDVGIDVVRRKRDRTAEAFGRRIELAQAVLRRAEAGVGFGVRRIQRQRAAVAVRRRFELFEAAQGLPKPVVHFGVVWSERQRVAIAYLRRFGLADCEQRGRHDGVQPDHAGVEFEGAALAGHGRFELAGTLQRNAELGVRLGAVGRLAHRALQPFEVCGKFCRLVHEVLPVGEVAWPATHSRKMLAHRSG